MIVAYEPPVMDRIRVVRHEAIMQCRTISKIVLTELEMNELLAFLGEHLDPIKHTLKVLGIPVEQEPEPQP